MGDEQMKNLNVRFRLLYRGRLCPLFEVLRGRLRSLLRAFWRLPQGPFASAFYIYQGVYGFEGFL